MPNNSSNTQRTIIAIVGMPGSGKSEVVSYLKQKGMQSIRFGEITEDQIKAMGLPQTPENEQKVREDLRRMNGMDIYAVKSLPKINELLQTANVIIDGLYSWEEYTYLIKSFPQLIVIHIYAQRQLRYERLIQREIRPFTVDEAKLRDVTEIENLHKGGPIAIADYLIDNNETVEELHKKIDALLQRLHL